MSVTRNQIRRMSVADLNDLLDTDLDDDIRENIYDEIESRQIAMENFDWDEQDRRAASEERIQMWRDEY